MKLTDRKSKNLFFVWIRKCSGPMRSKPPVHTILQYKVVYK